MKKLALHRGIPGSFVPLAFACSTGEPLPNDSGEGVEGDWSLREVVDEGESITFPQVYEFEDTGCTYTMSIDLHIDGAEGTLTYTYAVQGCDDPSYDQVYSFDDPAEVEIDQNEILIEMESAGLMICMLHGASLSCEVETEGVPSCTTIGSDEGETFETFEATSDGESTFSTSDSDSDGESGEESGGIDTEEGGEEGGCDDPELDIDTWRFERP
jgi:hypothetical protein